MPISAYIFVANEKQKIFYFLLKSKLFETLKPTQKRRSNNIFMFMYIVYYTNL